MSAPPLPLKGRTILDCSTLLPGPFAGKLLVQQGARVLKIESPGRPDAARDMGAYYQDLNENKELVWLDLTRDEDRVKFADLVRAADGLIEGFRPNAKKKLGLDEATLHGLNPKLCIASIVGYPETGPCRDRAGHDLNFQALSGCLSLFNEMPGLAFSDLFGAYECALSMASMLDAVSRGASGMRTVTSLSETLKSVQSKQVRQFHVTGELPRPGSTLMSGRYPCYRVYRSGDGRRIAVGALEHKFWQKVCELIQKPQLIDKGYVTGEEARRVGDEVQEAFGARAWQDWAPLFEEADCCVEPVLDYSEVFPRGI